MVNDHFLQKKFNPTVFRYKERWGVGCDGGRVPGETSFQIRLCNCETECTDKNSNLQVTRGQTHFPTPWHQCYRTYETTSFSCHFLLLNIK